MSYHKGFTHEQNIEKCNATDIFKKVLNILLLLSNITMFLSSE